MQTELSSANIHNVGRSLCWALGAHSGLCPWAGRLRPCLGHSNEDYLYPLSSAMGRWRGTGGGGLWLLVGAMSILSTCGFMAFDGPPQRSEWRLWRPVPQSSRSVRFLGMRKRQEQGCKTAEIYIRAGGNQGRAGEGKVLRAERAISTEEPPQAWKGAPPLPWQSPTRVGVWGPWRGAAECCGQLSSKSRPTPAWQTWPGSRGLEFQALCSPALS